MARNQERGLSADEIRSFFSRSLGGRNIVARIQNALSWLTDPSNVLAFRDEREKYKLTTLGLSAARGILPLQMGAGVGQLIRDLLSIDDSDGLLGQWRPLDHLIVLNLLAENAIQLRHFSDSLVEAVDAWMERNSQSTPLLYRQWIIGQSGQSRSAEVLGSLGINRTSQSCDVEENARREAYLAVFRSIILYELGNGQSIYDVERRWKLKGLDGIQERLRDDFLWMLSGLEKIYDVRCFYFHLKEECQADKDRIQGVKKSLRMLQIQTFELREHIKYCSPLGPLLRSLRRSRVNGDDTHIGIQSLRRLEDAGFRTLAELAGITVEDMTRLGLRPSVANKIITYVRLRLN